MDMFDSLFCAGRALCEQIGKEVFSNLPDGGPIVVIMDMDGNCRLSDSERFAQLNISESYLKELRSKVDDGGEPVVSQLAGCSVIATQLATEDNNCGYVIIILPQYGPESTLANFDLIEMLLNQVNLIAQLIEKNNHLYEVQAKQLRLYGESLTASN